MRLMLSYIATVVLGAMLAFALVAVLRPVVQDLLAAPAALLVSPK